MKRSIVILALAGALAVSAAQPVLAQSAPAAQIDPGRMALARQLVELSGGESQARAQIKMMFEAVRKGVEQSLPADQRRILGPVYSDMEQELEGITPQLMEVSVRIYAENYTDRELRDAIAFRMSDSGQSIAKKAPAIRAEAVNETVPLVMTLMPAILKKAVDRACDEAHCNAQQRQIIAQAVSKATGTPAS